MACNKRTQSDSPRSVERAPRRLKDRASYSTHDPQEAAHLSDRGCHLLVDEARCRAWREWLFTGEDVPLAAVKLRLEPHELRWLAQRDRTRAPDAPLEYMPPIRTTSLCAPMYTGETTSDEAEAEWAMEGRAGQELNPERLTKTHRPGGLGGATERAMEKDVNTAAQWEASARSAAESTYTDELAEELEEEPDLDMGGLLGKPPEAPSSWDVFLNGREAWDRARPDLAEQRRAYREREARTQAEAEAKKQEMERNMAYTTLWVTTERVMAILRITRAAVQNWRKKHGVPVQKDGGRNLYRLEDVLEYATGQHLFGVHDVPEEQGA